MKIVKAFLIARVSTEDQADALSAQVYRLEEYAKSLSLDYEIFEIRESAYKGNRKQFNDILKRVVTSSDPVALIFDKVDRYSRDPSSDIVRTINALVDSGNVVLHFCSDHMVIDKRSSAGELFMLDMNTSMSKYYSKSISDNVKRRNEQLHRDGYWTAKAPFGYINTTRDGKKWVEPHPLHSQAVKDAYEMYGSNTHTLASIRDHWLECYGVRTTTSLVDKVLHNPFYSGTMHTSSGDFIHRYETLVSGAEASSAEAVRQHVAEAPRKYASLPFPYRGIVQCSLCGGAITFERKKQRYTYGHCTQYRAKHDAAYVSEASFTEQFSDMFNSLKIPKVLVGKILDALKADTKKDAGAKRDAILKLRSSLESISSQNDQLYDHYASGKISESYYQNRYEKNVTEQEIIKTRISTFELDKDVDIEAVSNLLEFANNAKIIFQNASDQDKRELLQKVLSNSQLNDRKLLWKLKRPYELMAFCNDNSTWQGHVESNHDPRFWKPIY